VCDVILGDVRANLGVGVFCGKDLNSGAVAWLWEKLWLVGNVATVCVCVCECLTDRKYRTEWNGGRI
jgi:hypothetical protein